MRKVTFIIARGRCRRRWSGRWPGTSTARRIVSIVATVAAIVGRERRRGRVSAPLLNRPRRRGRTVGVITLAVDATSIRCPFRNVDWASAIRPAFRIGSPFGAPVVS